MQYDVRAPIFCCAAVEALPNWVVYLTWQTVAPAVPGEVNLPHVFKDLAGCPSGISYPCGYWRGCRQRGVDGTEGFVYGGEGPEDLPSKEGGTGHP